ncbi:unnamed protein product, partial [Phaeothamnion confervicola]
MQASWHPLAADCIAVLAVSDAAAANGPQRDRRASAAAAGGANGVALWLHDCRHAEPTQVVPLAGDAVAADDDGNGGGNGDGESDAGVVSFAFGSDRGWQRFAVWLLKGDGTVMVACPVVPPGAAVRRAHLRALLAPVTARIVELDRFSGNGGNGRDGERLSPTRPPADDLLETRNVVSEKKVLEEQRRWLLTVFGRWLATPAGGDGSGGDEDGDDRSLSPSQYGGSSGRDRHGEENGMVEDYVDVRRPGSSPDSPQRQRRRRKTGGAGDSSGYCGSGGGGYGGGGRDSCGDEDAEHDDGDLNAWVQVAGPVTVARWTVAVQDMVAVATQSPAAAAAGDDNVAACRIACLGAGAT